MGEHEKKREGLQAGVGAARADVAHSRLYYLWLPAIVVLLIAIVVIVNLRQTRVIVGLTQLINNAGRQRMLSQRLATIASQLRHEDDPQAMRTLASEMRGVVEDWSRRHKKLQNGNAWAEVDPEIRSLLHTIQPIYSAIRVAVEKVSLAPSVTESAATSKAIDEILKQQPAFLATMDRVVDRYEADSLSRLQTHERIQWGASAVAILAIAVQAWLIMRRTQALHRLASQQQIEIEKRKQAEETIRASKERYEQAVTGSSDGIWDWNVLTNTVYFSPRMKELLGYEDDELDSSFAAWETRLHADDREQTLAALKKHLEQRSPYRVEFRLRMKSGDYNWFLGRGQAVWDDTGRAIRMSGALTDISRQKAQERALQRLNEELEAFCYSVSHDLRAPLRHIDGFTKALVEDYGDDLNDGARTMLQMVCESSQEMGDLIDDLLALSRVTRSEMSCEVVDLSQLAGKIASRFQRDDPERKVEWSIAEGIRAPADRRLLERVLYNLLANAWKYTAKSPVANIEFGRNQSDGMTDYFVRDNGVGFDMTYSDQLFKPFQRLHPTTEFAGTGIGLTIVQRIVKRHGGSIRAEAEEGKGATFYFTLGATLDMWEHSAGVTPSPPD